MSTHQLNFPILDFSKFGHDFNSFADELFKASAEWGFFILTEHGVQGVDRMFELSRQFFDLPLDVKAEKPMDSEAIGFDGDRLTSFAASEGFSFGKPAGGLLTSSNLPAWWDLTKRSEIEAFKAECEILSRSVLSCFAFKMGLDKNYFKNNHTSDPGNTLKMIKYPRFTEQPSEVPRLSEHTDWGSITFVFTSQPGLEVRDPSNRWYDVPLVPGGIIVNIADALSLWTNQSLKSTMHRISWANLDINQDRYSIAYFTNPDYDALLSLCDEEDEEPALSFRDYYKVRLGLTFGSIRNGSELASLDPAVVRRIEKLQVANSGKLISHRIESS
ncbi:uncharacterized protein FMAN_15165 [Fusarium mangiferae]|uniref:Fe2OG dioxygenase domain-containing protein n=1 Tax=Fusarium mangiferae TaxID=192010 RepID=A0A1L7TY10_FUSMA|nr:uncharacterized protein FMAN_15165 [Fusarium mangiferae]CVL03490.1 uncharacterized protein FMAN_15165 [Fusarium mangiferae]